MANIAHFAEKLPGYSLKSGSRFASLARYLQQPDRPLKSGEKPDGYFVSLTSNDGKEVQRFNDVREFADYSRNGRGDSPSLLFMRGFPSPEWVRTVGSIYGVDPEFFRRHMDLEVDEGDRYFALPSLPSFADHIIQFRLTTIGEWALDTKEIISKRGVEDIRSRCIEQINYHRRSLRKGIGVKTGGSILRHLSAIDENYFIIEQQISACLKKSGDGKCSESSPRAGLQFVQVIVWLDIGNSFDDTFLAPATILYPIIQPFRVEASVPRQQQSLPRHEDHHLSQGTSFIDLEYGKLLEDGPTGYYRPLHALIGLLKYTAYGECQFFNMVGLKLRSQQRSSHLLPSRDTLANLVFYKGILEDHTDRLRDTIAFIDIMGSSIWSMSAVISDPARDILVPRLQKDYDVLMSRAEELTTRCCRAMDTITTDAQIMEVRKGIQQSLEVTRLTRLAFVFIPLIFTASFLSMNIAEFTNGSLTIRIWFFITIPLFVLSILVLYVDIINLATNLIQGVTMWYWNRTFGRNPRPSTRDEGSNP